MKKGWQTKKVSEIAKHSLGKMLDKAKNKGKPQPYLRNLNVRWFDFDLSDVLEMPFLPTEAAKYTAVKGDVLICEGGYPGRAAIWEKDEPIYFQKALHRVRFHEPERNRWFLYYLLSKDLDDTLKDHFNGAGIQHFTGEALARFEVPLPPLAEQQRIVGLLDEAFEGLATAKANAERNHQNARALFESHLQSVFTQRGPGWVEKKVSEIAKHSLGKMLDKATNKGEPQPYLRNINVRWFTFDLSDLLQMPFLPTEAEKYTAIKGDVLICEGGYPGRAAIWDEDYPIYFQKALHRVRFHQPELNKWFVYYLSVQDSSGQLKKHFSGTGIQHFTGEVLARFPIPVPPLPELRQAVAKFDALSEETQRLARLYERKLAALEALKKSLLHQAFTGAL
ncbi:MAG: restriction endonuclease subunit S [Burkholderiales bacterium]|nr:restriction endonuclease subunit S [Opitutaceae bacterium]